jgi:phosphomevalonate kinase
MIEVMASAPGKLVLLGDYAVLEGAPALVMAVNRHAKVRICAKSGGLGEVSAAQMDASGVPLRILADGRLEWLGSADHAARLRLVEQTLYGLSQAGLAPQPGRGFSLQLDTAEFFDRGRDGLAKLGLGSSAALTVALASTLAVFVGRGAATANRRVWLEQLLQLHREFQGGHGSGVDVAAGLIGGVISYRLVEGGSLPRFEPMNWPGAVHTLFVWSGRSASTSDFLERLALWRKTHGAEYASQMSALGAISSAAQEAIVQGRSHSLVEACAAYAAALRAFGLACGLDIFSAEHVQIAELAGRAGVSYKPCGAGGGDFGVAFSLDPERLAQLERSVAEAGFRCVPLAVDEAGLQLDYTGF